MNLSSVSKPRPSFLRNSGLLPVIQMGTHPPFLLFTITILWCAALVTARILHTGSQAYLFLLWNLFLAIIPLGLALILAQTGRPGDRPCLQLAFFVAWLLFFPNVEQIDGQKYCA